MGHALFDRGLQRVVVRIDVVDISLNSGGKSVGLELCAAEVGVALTGCDRAPGGFADREVCEADIGLAVASYVGCWSVARNASIVILGFENVEGSRPDVRRAQEKACRQLTLDGQIPFIDRREMVHAARIVRHGNLVERRIVCEVRGRWERARKLWIGTKLCAGAVQRRLRCRQSAEGIAEGTGRRTRSGGAVAGGG